MSGIPKRYSSGQSRLPGRIALKPLLIGFFVASVSVHFSSSAALGLQTRDECDKCCQHQGFDEYYTEQCKLKCFRNHDHCVGEKSMRPPAAKPSAEAPAPQRPPSAEPPRPQAKRSAFRWPNPLNLVPGREREAAEQILAVNGIPPQHPGYAVALQSVTNVLMNFARAHPKGGKLPTAQLEQILRQLR
ncbi:MAG: hypothetical protein WBG50_23930 [Desulfomonilaceae bacterium]